jgi:hypothetical protein
VYEGKHTGGEVGGYDVYVMLAERYHWTPEQVDRLDPDYIDELMIRISVEAEHQEIERKKQERERKRAANKPKGGRRGEDVDIADIT